MVATTADIRTHFRTGESLTDKVKTVLLNLVCPERPERMLPTYELRHKYMKAAECAARMGNYERAFRNYDKANDHFAFMEGMYLAESLQDHHKALDYALKAKDYVEAGFIQARLGRPEQAFKTWQEMLRAA